MSRWFRVYDELLDDPKVQRLHPLLFKVLVNLWCVASRHDGRLPTIADIGFALRMPEDETLRAVSKLAEAGFIDTDAATGEQRPHGWDARQYRSDVSTDRVRKHREARKFKGNGDKDPPEGGGKRNGDETFHGTPPETEQRQKQNSVAKATGTVVPHPAVDFVKAVFDSGRALLVASGSTEREAGAIVGRWRKKVGDAQLLVILKHSEIEGHSDPVAWITAAVENHNGDRPANDRQDTDFRDPFLRHEYRTGGADQR